MRKITFTFLLGLAITAGTFSMVYAKTEYTTLFNNTYGTSGTDKGTSLGSCITCHNQTDGSGGYNGYGRDWLDNGRSFGAIESLDSDGDGFNNIDEILAGTFPGDPNDAPPIVDTTPPTVTDFSVPATAFSLAVPINSFAATDDVGVTGYMVTESATAPGASDLGWNATPPISYTFAAPGIKTLHAWAKDAAGNVSNSLSAVVDVSPNPTGNQPPSADAGPDQTVDEGDTVTLDGSNSTDPDDYIASYLWTQTGGLSVTLSDPAAVQPPFVTPIVDPALDPNGITLTFNLTVEDSGGLQAGAVVSVTVSDNGITGFPADVLTVMSATGRPLGIRVDGGGNLTRLGVVDPTTIPPTSDKPESLIHGLLNIQLRVGTPGATATVTVYLPAPAPDGYRWYKYGTAEGWIDYGAHAVFNPARDQVILTLIDGAVGDDDGVANGVIADPSGLGAAPTNPSSSIGGNEWGAGGGCFIATAAYGSPMAQNIKALRDFRDRFLITNCVGKAFVDLYSIYSPPVADFIANHDTLRALVRLSLLPIVGVSWIALNIGLIPTLTIILLMLILINTSVLVLFRRIRMRTHRN